MPTKQKSGLYRTKVKIGVDANGKDSVKWISGKTKKELEAERQKVIAYYIDGTALHDDRLFGEYAVEWYRVRKEPFISQSTKNAYRSMLNKHALPAFGDRKLRAIRPIELQEFVNRFAGASKSQITMVVSVLDGIFSAAVQDQILHLNPAASLRRPEATPPEERRALTEEECQRIIPLFSTHRYGPYLATMYYTGMRPGEVRGLQWGDFDWAADLVHVQRDVDYSTAKATVGELKTAAADRFIPIPAPLKALLWPRRGVPGAFVFQARGGGPYPQATAERAWLELMLAAGMVEPVEHSCYSQSDIRGRYRAVITPYTLRHNFITMCWENGMDLTITMKIVGHADYQTTRNIYTHLARKHLEKAKDKLGEMFGEEKVAQKLHNLPVLK